SNYQSWAKPYTRDWWSDPLLNTDKMLLFFKKILDKNKPESRPPLVWMKQVLAMVEEASIENK
ncbi:MAG: hypothetical protein K8T10_10975, partial [Candidatus Eremiobacteraeota bacterium]|nr:hypothetical protein [Candidatus Eremiobacteraeota bacterium]